MPAQIERIGTVEKANPVGPSPDDLLTARFDSCAAGEVYVHPRFAQRALEFQCLSRTDAIVREFVKMVIYSFSVVLSSSSVTWDNIVYGIINASVLKIELDGVDVWI